ncbi:MAG: Rrf2 family transcriptional regulator [Ignavibacteria bacterium]|nr:Rrf2 family transcriptional regulator [Ignavibacteria bacterium]
MKFSAQEEYGLRCLLRIAKDTSGEGLTIPQISQAEGLTQANVAKLLRILRMGGYIDSSRGAYGGYKLTKPAEDIIIGDVLAQLGGKLFETSFCSDFTGKVTICTHTIDCSIKSLWNSVQHAVDGVLQKTTLKDLIAVKEFA